MAPSHSTLHIRGETCPYILLGASQTGQAAEGATPLEFRLCGTVRCGIAAAPHLLDPGTPHCCGLRLRSHNARRYAHPV
ncbi:MAG: hypothetical protein NZ699_11230 [Roseiflexus sp.]|nr:hypothetical protein [Roseiflexus sp.]MCS7289691.1 hypothetical protein [Roseiflexus sp.]MDW8148718.1 hypothetical protein [Roseiflexaceae bacterium]